jgi:diguanylate cyclase (GGDEF)-like protein
MEVMMNQFLEIVLILVALMSIIPVINIQKNRKDSKYGCLKMLIYTSALWTILVLTERISSNLFISYYSHMLSYPVKMILSTFMLCTVFQYVGKKFPRWILVSLGTLIIVDFIISLSNSSTNWMMKLAFSDYTNFIQLFTSDNGIIFYIHLTLTYLILLSAIVLLFIFLRTKKDIRSYKEVNRTMGVSIIVVVLFNLFQLFSDDIYIDLTYISLIFAVHILYIVIYRKDMVFNLRISGRTEILANMREMYILADRDKRIIEISPLLIEKYNIRTEDIIGKNFDDLVNLLSDQVVLYSEYNVDEETSENKDHYHLRERKFKLSTMNEYGFMFLLFDETQVYNLLRQLNRLSNYDTMTGLNNRNYIENKLSNYEHQTNLGVISLDLNGLKVNNDYLGHERGDYLLKKIASKMKEVFSIIGKKEMARIGGDEFIVILPNTNLEEIEKLSNELLTSCDAENVEDRVSVSLGYAFDKDGERSIYGLIQKADASMYQMKSETSDSYKKEMIEYIKIQDKYIR